jgi:hypothetical protein
MAPPKILAALGDDFKLRSRPEVDDDARAAIFLECGNGVTQPVRTELGGIVDQDGHACLDAGFDEHRLDVEVGFAHEAQRGVNGRDDRGDDDVLDLGGVDAFHVEEIDEERAVLVHGLRAMGGEAPVGGQLGGIAVEPVEAELGVGVADIEGEQHGLL